MLLVDCHHANLEVKSKTAGAMIVAVELCGIVINVAL